MAKKTNVIPVTDHAIVRYFERVEGRDIDKIKTEINNPELIRWYKTIGDGGKYPVNNKYRAVINGGVVVTIVPIK